MTADAADLRLDHRSPIGADAREDLEIVVPRHALDEMVRQGVLGGIAPAFLAFVGGTELHQQIEDELVPNLLRELRDLEVDLALLVPY